jgi:hypothetical protein
MSTGEETLITRRRTTGLTAGACLLALLFPVGASAAVTKPAVTTGAAANIAITTATLTGTVNPHGGATTYFFQIGPTSLYGSQTAPVSAGKGTSGVKVAAAVGNLAPATRYHYRLVAQNGKGLVKGKDRTFKTKKQPLGLILGATPSAVRAGGATTLSGTLSGTGNANRQVALQANPFPYTQGFVTVGNSQVTNAGGGFSFAILSVPVNTQYRVLMPNNPSVISPILVVGAKPRVTTHVKRKRGGRFGHIRFSGSLSPAVDGQLIAVQKLVKGVWRTIAHTTARHHSASKSSYKRTVRQRHGGRYRILALVQGAYSPNVGRTVHVRLH